MAIEDGKKKNPVVADSAEEKSTPDEKAYEKRAPENSPAVVETRLKAELMRERMSTAKKSSRHESEALAEKIAHDYFLELEEEKKTEGPPGSSSDKNADRCLGHLATKRELENIAEA